MPEGVRCRDKTPNGVLSDRLVPFGRQWSHAVLAGMLLASPAGLIGCRGEQVKNVPVTGRVVVDGGAPIDEGRLTLIPDPPAPKRALCGAVIGTDGSFECYANAGGAGIPPGRYKVVLAFASAKGKINPFQKAFDRYTKIETTPLALDVPASGLKDVELKLKEPK